MRVSVNSLSSWSAFEAVDLHASLQQHSFRIRFNIFIKMTSKFIMPLTISTCTQPPMKRQTHRWPKEDYSLLFLWETWYSTIEPQRCGFGYDRLEWTIQEWSWPISSSQPLPMGHDSKLSHNMRETTGMFAWGKEYWSWMIRIYFSFQGISKVLRVGSMDACLDP